MNKKELYTTHKLTVAELNNLLNGIDIVLQEPFDIQGCCITTPGIKISVIDSIKNDDIYGYSVHKYYKYVRAVRCPQCKGKATYTALSYDFDGEKKIMRNTRICRHCGFSGYSVNSDRRHEINIAWNKAAEDYLKNKEVRNEGNISGRLSSDDKNI